MNMKRWWSLPCVLLAVASCDDDDGRPGAAGGAGGQADGGGTAGGQGESGQGGQGAQGQGGQGQGAQGGQGAAGADAGAQQAPSTVGVEPVATGLTSPVALQAAPGGAEGFFVADQIGTIRVIANGQLVQQPFLDISARMIALNDSYDERGLLGMAFHPDFAANGRFFVYYSAPLRAAGPAGYDHTSRLSEFQVTAGDSAIADASSERILLEIDQPQTNHNGGQLTFGPDGYLYISLGDGGAANDVGLGHVEDWYEINDGGNGQDLEQNLLGSILRIDVNTGDPYAIPQDNPFADSAAPEVWAYGFRNAFRMAFDSGGTQQLFAGDVGQNLWEEVDVVTRGGNYGWNVKEGTRCFSTANPNETLASCPSQDPEGDPLIDPILEYPHPEMVAAQEIAGLGVIGGYVYRGSAIPRLRGRYLFGDWSRSFGAPDGRLFVASPPDTDGSAWTMAPIGIANRDSGNLGEYILSFGQDAAGELYVLTSGATGPTGSTGTVYRIVP